MPTARLPVLLAVLFLPACVPTLTGGAPAGDDDDAGSDLFDGLDADDDGQLTADDLEPGQAAVFLERELPDGGGGEEAHLTSDVYLIHRGDLDDWILQVGLETDPLSYLNIAFDSASGEPEVLGVGTSAITAVSVDIPAIEHGGSGVTDAEDTMTISEVGEADASGYAELLVEVPLGFYGGEPSGEVVRVRAVAFRGAERDTH